MRSFSSAIEMVSDAESLPKRGRGKREGGKGDRSVVVLLNDQRVP
jgi:hypothetical protein